ncbi:MAG: acyclic terpene utilization AtuA family protein [Sporichthyaceae bacterium]
MTASSPAPRRERIIIANCGGFWGDDPTAARRQVEGGPIDYLVMDYLAEVTMAILQKQMAKNPALGYAADFLTQMRDVLAPCMDKGVRIIANAGGVNPGACATALQALAAELGVADKLKVAVVAGDNLYSDLDDLIGSGQQLAHMDNGAPMAEVRERVLSANVYLGTPAIVRALELGANVIIAGRVTDTSVTLAPMLHHFGWALDDWDKLASGVVAGHIIECGCQCTGGNFTDWHTVPDFRNMGYPLIEARADGTFVITKHPGTGGLVNVHTVSEQLLYEMGGPAYLSPDCIARFDSIALSQDGPDRVLVTGVKGEPPPQLLKVAASYSGGYRATGRMLVSGPDTLRKAHKAAEVFWAVAGGADLYDEAATQFIGWDASHPSLAGEEPSEVLMQVSVLDADKRKINERFAPMVVGSMLQSMPGMTMPGDQGRPRASDVVGHWPALIPRHLVHATVTVDGVTEQISSEALAYSDVSLPPAPLTQATEADDARELPTLTSTPESAGSAEAVTVPLLRLCIGRSGDKGDSANVGIRARSPQIYHWMLGALTADVVKDHFKGICLGEVDRFVLPNLLAVNFLLHESLGGGGTSSLRFDAQGKTFSQYLLSMPVTVPAALVATAR